MSYLHSYIYLIVVVKIVFILTAVSHIYLRVNGEENSELDKKIIYWKERIEFIFIILMSLLLIYLFHPNNRNVEIDNETKFLLYLFGFLLIITAKWSAFFEEATWFKDLQKIVGKIN